MKTQYQGREKYTSMSDFVRNLISHNFGERVSMCSAWTTLHDYSEINDALDYMENRGFIKKKTDFSVSFDSGEAYVYLWKHMRGHIFYVGSGINGRSNQKNRTNDFLRELDRADAVLYIVADGLDRETAFKIERYISGWISMYGDYLTNKDNRVDLSDKESFCEEMNELSKEIGKEKLDAIESAVLGTSLDDKFSYCDALIPQAFIEEYGLHFFSKDSES